MSAAKQNDVMNLVAGLGKTGLSVARYLKATGADAIFYDSRSEPPGVDALDELWPDARLLLGSTTLPEGVGRVIASPLPREPWQRARTSLTAAFQWL